MNKLSIFVRSLTIYRRFPSYEFYLVKFYQKSLRQILLNEENLKRAFKHHFKLEIKRESIENWGKNFTHIIHTLLDKFQSNSQNQIGSINK